MKTLSSIALFLATTFAWTFMAQADTTSVRTTDWTYVPNDPRGLSPTPPPPTYSIIEIGQGLNSLTGNYATNCWDKASMEAKGISVLNGNTDFKLVKTDFDFASYLKFSGSLSVSGSVGLFAGKASASGTTVTDSHITNSHQVVVARLDWNEGTRFMNGLPKLQSKYAVLDTPTFLQTCGTGFLQQVMDGASLLVVFEMDKLYEMNENDDELQAAMEIRYGPISGNASVALTERQKAILNSYSIHTRCYTQGGDFAVCKLIDNGNQIQAAVDAMINAVKADPTNTLVGIKTNYVPYATQLDQDSLNSFVARNNTMEDFEQWRSNIQMICNQAPYLADNCNSVYHEIDLAENDCADFGKVCPSLDSIDPNDLDMVSNLGQVTFYQDADLQGNLVRFNFRVDNKAGTDGSLKPNLLYKLDKVNFSKKISSLQLDPRMAQFWAIEFYENADGTGAVWTTMTQPAGTQNYWYVGPEFNDRAASFRLVLRGL